MATFSSLKILSTLRRCIIDDDKAAIPHNRRSFFPDDSIISNSISRRLLISMSQTSFLLTREGLNNRFKGGWAIFFFESESESLFPSNKSTYIVLQPWYNKVSINKSNIHVKIVRR